MYVPVKRANTRPGESTARRRVDRAEHSRAGLFRQYGRTRSCRRFCRRRHFVTHFFPLPFRIPERKFKQGHPIYFFVVERRDRGLGIGRARGFSPASNEAMTSPTVVLSRSSCCDVYLSNRDKLFNGLARIPKAASTSCLFYDGSSKFRPSSWLFFF